ncbi:MAG: GGDEF domain-containing protein [Thermoanaerobaculia bacterium]
MKIELPSTAWTLSPLAAVLLAVIIAGRSPTLAPEGIFPFSAELLGWALLGALAALHRPFAVDRPGGERRGSVTLGLGTLVLAPAAERLGAVPAVWVASLAFLAASVELRDTRRIHLVRLAPVAAATLAGTAVFVSGSGTTLLPVGSYLGVFVVFHAATVALERRFTPRAPAVPWRPARFFPLILDAAGWVLGISLTAAAAAAGWRSVSVATVACALLAAEAARNALLRRASAQRAGKLERMQLAHARILGQTSDMEEIARQIYSECRRVLPVHWFQLELIGDPTTPPDAGAPDAGAPDRPEQPTSWAAGPDGAVFAGRPKPPNRPRMIPGIHRRAAWRVFEEPLEAEDTTLAVVRLWCDPRRIKPGTEKLFSSLVPQMTSSVHRARLEREATLDPLTQVPVRRKLETRLANAYHRSCDDGVSMAVIMCDLDFFNRINDTFGHAAGDRALIVVARILDSRRRESDFCCRYGGEEFALLLERATGEAALQLAERLRLAVEALDLTDEGQAIPLTLSAGVAAFPEVHVKTAGELLLLADEALYEAKEQGRNQCLLNVGQGVYRSAAGTLIRGAEELPKPPPPRIFD